MMQTATEDAHSHMVLYLDIILDNLLTCVQQYVYLAVALLIHGIG